MWEGVWGCACVFGVGRAWRVGDCTGNHAVPCVDQKSLLILSVFPQCAIRLWRSYCFRVMVMSDGLIVEFDSPTSLLSKPDSIFSGMVREAGIISWTSGCYLKKYNRHIDLLDTSICSNRAQYNVCFAVYPRSLWFFICSHVYMCHSYMWRIMCIVLSLGASIDIWFLQACFEQYKSCGADS